MVRSCVGIRLFHRIKKMNLATAFAGSVKQRPDKTALFWGEREDSYTELWAQSLTVSTRLRQPFGVRPRARIGIWLKNCPQFIPTSSRPLRTRAVALPINTFLKPAQRLSFPND